MAEDFDLIRTAACVEAEDDLAQAVQLVREGGDPAGVYPALSVHLQGCRRCTLLLAELVGGPESGPAVRNDRVDTDDLFERSLVPELERSDALVRLRIADRLGRLSRPGPATLGVLAERASDDEDENVRRVALRALDRLDSEVSIPDRLIEAWAATPTEAEPFIAGVLERLAGSPVASVLGLQARRRSGPGLAVTGQGGVRGSVGEEQDELWLRLQRLPAPFEATRPVVALPMALSEQASPLQWSGQQPGLVPAQAPVADGALDVLLGSGAPAQGPLFQRMYLLNPEVPAAPA